MRASVRGVNLKNSGMYVCRLDILWYDDNNNEHRVKCSGNLPLSHDYTVYPDSYGIPDGSIIKAYLDVQAGNDKKGYEAFLFDTSASGIAKYLANGTTLDNEFRYLGIS